MVVIHLLDILVSCVEEADVISQEILDIILGNLIEVDYDTEGSSQSQKNHSAKLLAEKLIVTTEKYLKEPIEKMLIDIITGKGCSSDIKDRYHDIIYELFYVAPNLLQTVLPQLTIEIGCEDAVIRKKAIHLLAKIFAVRGDAAQTHFQLFNTLMKRFLDIDPEIRIIMIQFGKHFLQTSDDADSISNMNKELEKRLRDKDEKVRDVAVTCVCEAAIDESSAEHISIELLEELILRLRDRKNTIRRNSMLGLAKIYKFTQEKIQSLASKKSKDLSGKKLLEIRNESKKWKDKFKVFNQIYSKILQCYFLPDLEDKLRVESIISEEILGSRSNSKTAALNKSKKFMAFISSLDDNALSAFIRLLEDKRVLRDEFRSWLISRQNHEQDKMAKKAQSITLRLTGSSAMDKWKKFSSLNDEMLFRSLATIVDTKSTLKQINTAYDTIKRRYWKENVKNATLKDYIKLIIDRLTFRFVEEDVLKFTIEKLTHNDDSDDSDDSDDEDSHKVDRYKIFDVLLSLSSSIPSCLMASLPLTSALLELKDEEESDKSLRIIYNFIQSNVTDFSDEKDIRVGLASKSLNGSRKQSKYAIKSLIHMNDTTFLKKHIGQLVADVTKGSNSSALISLIQVCKHDVKLLGKHESRLVEHVKSLCEGGEPIGRRTPSKRTPTKKSPAKKSPAKRNKESNADDIQCAAIEFLGYYIISNSALDAEQAQSLRTLIFESLDVDHDEFKRAAAALTTLRLAESKKQDFSLPLDIYMKIAYMALDPSDHIKKTIHDKLFKALRTVSLPLKFLAILPLFQLERGYDVRKELQVCIQIRRKIMKDRTSVMIEKTRKGLSQDDESTRQATQALPEYSLPYLIYLLAHSEFFEDDAPKYLRTIKYLSFFVGELLNGSDNYVFLKQLLQDMKQTEDAQDGSYRGVHTVTDICRLIVNQKHSQATVDFTKVVHPGVIFLPSELFKVHEEGDDEKKLLPANESYLPSNFKLPDHGQTSRMLVQNEKPVTPKKRKRKDSAPITPKRGKNRVED